MKRDFKIAVIGLGYVGFPLACLFAGKYPVVGFDLNAERVRQLAEGIDRNNEVSHETHAAALANGMRLTSDPEDIRDCNVYVVAVPTPVDRHHHPDMTPLERASRLIGSVISAGDIVIFESTVYPGATEEYCAPIIEEVSGLRLNEDFFLGYSPERINPGDRLHSVETIVKITSGSTPEIAEVIDGLYGSVLRNGTFKASSIKVAEAAKIMENTQRDINIAFMNEMAMIFDEIDIDIFDVIDAASTKWNFLPFKPGLVGGHCISVDPYYLIEQSKDKGIYPRLTTEARRINNSMAKYVVTKLIRQMTLASIPVVDSRILILGFTFKENCPDVRNTKIADVYDTLRKYTSRIQIFDPWADPEEVKRHYGIDILSDPALLHRGEYDAVIYGVKHSEFDSLGLESLCRPGGIFLDVKGNLDRKISTHRL